MAYYKVSICGENIFMNIEGKTERYGFYINIFTSGKNEVAVIKRAEESVKNKLQNTEEVEKDSLEIMKLTTEEVTIVEQPNAKHVEQGFVWYRDNELNS
jgi:hypothetical protein